MSEQDFVPPKGHEYLTHDKMHYLTHSNGKLYWKGTLLKTEQHLGLTFFQKAGAFSITLATISAPIVLALANWDTVSTNFCRLFGFRNQSDQVQENNSHIIINKLSDESDEWTVMLPCADGEHSVHLNSIKTLPAELSCFSQN